MLCLWLQAMMHTFLSQNESRSVGILPEFCGTGALRYSASRAFALEGGWRGEHSNSEAAYAGMTQVVYVPVLFPVLVRNDTTAIPEYHGTSKILLIHCGQFERTTLSYLRDAAQSRQPARPTPSVDYDDREWGQQ